jgi:hypothetical protein
MTLIKKYIYFVGLIIFCNCFLSCDKSIPCASATSSLIFVTFPDTETDTIIIRSFAKGTNFATLVDTFFINKLNSSYTISNDTLQIGNSFGGVNGLKSKYDYEIYLPQTNRLFKISEIIEEINHTTGGGLFSMDARGCINPIKSYKLNGLFISGDYNYQRFYIKR